MPNILDEVMLVAVDSGENHNKFYRAILNEDGTIHTSWGRVGATNPQSQVKQGGRGAFDSLIRAKERKGYRPVQVVAASSIPKPTNDKSRLKEAAQASLAGGSTDPVLTALIERLVAANKHQLMEASGGLISVDLAGQVTTPLGIISASALRDARALLDEMSAMNAGPRRGTLTEDYLRLVPQQVHVSAGRGWAEGWLTAFTTPQKQYTLLDGLEASVSYANAAQAAARRAAESAGSAEPVPDDLFRYRVRALTPTDADYQMVAERFTQTQQDVHAWSRSMKVARVFALEDLRHAADIAATAKRVGNVRRLWHGTGAANVLSILQKGLFVPPTRGSGIHIAGRMFGDGVYLSKSASKSVAYSSGVWGGDGRGSDSKFMFLTQTAMGSEYRPGPGHDSRIPQRARTEMNKFGKPYNSINVEPGMGGVRNHEAIVWDVNQVRLGWLVELVG